MMRTVVLCASLSILASCAKPFLPDPGPIADPAPQACDPRLQAPLEKEPPATGSIVAPVTEEEIEATREHLTGDAESRSWGRRGWDRAAIAQTQCAGLGVSDAPR